MTNITRRTFVAVSAGLGANVGYAARISSQGADATGSYGVIASEPADSVRAGARLLESGGNAFNGRQDVGLGYGEAVRTQEGGGLHRCVQAVWLPVVARPNQNREKPRNADWGTPWGRNRR